MSDYFVKIVSWQDRSVDLVMIRDKVFINEQSVPVELERDPNDPQYIHALACDSDNQPIGTGRLLNDGKIGRMAVLKEWRGNGVGQSLLLALIDAARAANLPEVTLDSQTHAQGFYQQQGFISYGDEFPDAGIPHIKMKRTI